MGKLPSWGCSSSGRASDWQSEGREFKSLQLHNEREWQTIRARIFLSSRFLCSGGSPSAWDERPIHDGKHDKHHDARDDVG